MTSPTPAIPTPPTGTPWNDTQKEYLAGLLSAATFRAATPFVGLDPAGRFTDSPQHAPANLAAEPREETVFGVPISDLTKQELWKHAENPLDSWDRLLEHAAQDRLPDEEHTYRFRTFGLFHVGPAQNSFMLRCRIPAGELTDDQFQGLAAIARDFGDGRAAITTRSNIQIRQIAPRHTVDVLVRLQSLGLTAKGSGVDNIRNITASPTAGIDAQELIDTRPFAHALHHYILNQRDLYGLPRKFNVAFEGGGTIDTVADTNDIGFFAVQVPTPAQGTSLADQAPVPIEPGVHFRVQLAGITGHRQLASDSGILIPPSRSVALAAAMIRVFRDHGDRTDRKKARLKYLIDRWGIPRFLAETQKRLAFPLVEFPAAACQPRSPSIKHAHIGVYRQRQPGRNYIGVVVPVGILSARQIERLANLARNYGSASIRLTPWQNLLIPDIPDAFVETVKRQIVRLGLHHESSHIAGGLVACTGNSGCKWAATDTKGNALTLAHHLAQRVHLDQPLNLHLTGCPNSCAQHYIGDIGLQGVKVQAGSGSRDGYHVVLGGGAGPETGIGRQIFTALPFSDLPRLLEHMLQTYLEQRLPGESFAAFTRRHETGQLQEIFTP
jgi:ferredoxin-nitrite reductase